MIPMASGILGLEKGTVVGKLPGGKLNWFQTCWFAGVESNGGIVSRW